MSFLATIGSNIITPFVGIVNPITGFFTRRSEMQTVQHVTTKAAPVAQNAINTVAKAVETVSSAVKSVENLGDRAITAGEALGSNALKTGNQVAQRVASSADHLTTTTGMVAGLALRETRETACHITDSLTGSVDNLTNAAGSVTKQAIHETAQSINHIADNATDITKTILSMPQQLTNTVDHEIRGTGSEVRRTFSNYSDALLAAANTAHRGAVAVGSAAMGTFMYVLATTCDANNPLLSPICHTFTYSATVCTGLTAVAVTAIVINTFRTPIIQRECPRPIVDTPRSTTPPGSEDEKETDTVGAETSLRRRFGFSTGDSSSSVTSESEGREKTPSAPQQDVSKPGEANQVQLTPEEELEQLFASLDRSKQESTRLDAEYDQIVAQAAIRN